MSKSVLVGLIVGYLLGNVLFYSYSSLKYECEVGTGGGAQLNVGKGVYCNSGDLSYRMFPYKSTPQRDAILTSFKNLIGPPGPQGAEQ